MIWFDKTWVEQNSYFCLSSAYLSSNGGGNASGLGGKFQSGQGGGAAIGDDYQSGYGCGMGSGLGEKATRGSGKGEGSGAGTGDYGDETCVNETDGCGMGLLDEESCYHSLMMTELGVQFGAHNNDMV
jgi:hypothetical protein